MSKNGFLLLALVSLAIGGIYSYSKEKLVRGCNVSAGECEVYGLTDTNWPTKRYRTKDDCLGQLSYSLTRGLLTGTYTCDVSASERAFVVNKG